MKIKAVLKTYADDLERKLWASELKVVELTGLQLPIQLTLGDIKIIKIHGGAFTKIKEFARQAIIEAFSSSQKIKRDARDKIIKALEKRTDRQVSMVITESGRHQNSFYVYSGSLIQFSVKGLSIYLFTKE